MQFDHAQILPYVIALLAVEVVYRRLRRSFGRQRLQPLRMRIRIGMLILLGATLLPAAVRSPPFLAADLAGLLVGIALGAWGSGRTRYERHDGRLYYVPHTYSGIAVSLLLIGRLAYRMSFVYSAQRAVGANPGDALQTFASPAMFRSPFTAALLFVVIGYYGCYYGRVLWKSTRIGPEDLEVSSTPIAVSSNEYGGSSPGR
jgi:hypothetical protein